jgi:hypothetical protein
MLCGVGSRRISLAQLIYQQQRGRDQMRQQIATYANGTRTLSNPRACVTGPMPQLQALMAATDP